MGLYLLMPYRNLILSLNFVEYSSLGYRNLIHFMLSYRTGRTLSRGTLFPSLAVPRKVSAVPLPRDYQVIALLT